MKHLVIRNLGPLKEADVELKRINVIIGSQSSGKSCVLKTACYCTWVEKRIELTQTSEFFAKDENFLKELERFHKLQGYIKPDTFISYESDFMAFSYDNATKTFLFDWKDDRWNYRRSKVTYIPAERNLVAAIPNWFQVKFNDDNIRDFMADWVTARQARGLHAGLLLAVGPHRRLRHLLFLRRQALQALAARQLRRPRPQGGVAEPRLRPLRGLLALHV